MDQIDIAWLAGVYEGEGCLSINGKAVRIIIQMTDEDIIRRIHSLTGCGRVAVYPHPKHKTVYRWTVNNRSCVARLLLAMAPLLGERRREKVLEAVPLLASRVYKVRMCPG